MQPKRIAIFAVASAPYRDEFYRLFAEHVAAEVVYLRVLDKAPDHAWSSTNNDQFGALKLRKIPAIAIKGSGFFRNWRAGRNPLVIPTPGTWRALVTCDADIIFVQEYSPVAILACFWARLYGRKVVTITEVGRDTPDLGIGTRLRHWFFGHSVDGQLANTVAACTPISAQVKQICFAPHAVIPPVAVPIRKPSAKVKILFVGNLIPRKGIDLLLAAVRLLQDGDQRNQFVLRLVGGGDRDWLEEDLNYLKGSVELAGFKEGEELQQEYACADIFVLPSRFDTFGVVAHEAASWGLPLVLSSRAGCSELFGEREGAAEVVDPENTKCFTEVLGKLISDPSFRENAGVRARNAANKWSAPANAGKMAEWVKNLQSD